MRSRARLSVLLPLLVAVAPAEAALAPKAACADPVTGVWHGLWYSTDAEDWHDFRLTIARDRPGSGKLVGSIEATVWDGDASATTPPACRGQIHYSVRMPATGAIEGTKVSFAGTEVFVTKVTCAEGTYRADTLSGVLAGDQLVLTNDDGARSMGDIHFKRERCTAPGR